MRAKYCLTLLVVLTSLLYTAPSFASAEGGDGHIRGRVISEHGHKPIADAIVELIAGQKVLYNSQTDRNGKFTLPLDRTNSKRKHFVLRISHISHETYIMRVERAVRDVELPDIIMKEWATDLSECVVTSTRTQRHHKDVPIPTQVITKAQIDRIAPTSMKDVLLYSIPGIEFHQHGGITHITMQGYSADYITFLIDGEEVAGLKSGSIDLTRLSPENIERVEVIKGAGSALYGSNAIAGVINIITRQYDKPVSMGVSQGYSERGGWTSHAQVGVKNKYFSNSLSGSYDREGGYTLKNKNESSELKVIQNDIQRIGNRFKFTPNDFVSIGLDVNYSRRRQYLDEFKNDIYDYLTNSLKMGWQSSPVYRISLLYNGDISWRNREYIKTGREEIQHRNFVNVLRLQHDLHLGEGNDINFGAEGHLETMLSSQINSAEETKSIKYGVLFAQHLWQVHKNLNLLYGARADYHSNYGLHLSPKATLSYKVHDFTLRGGYARAFKSPTVMELYFNWSHQGMFDIIGNPDLKPETANQFLSNIEWSKAGVTLSAGITHTIFKDRITMQQDEKGDQQHVNLDGTTRMTVVDANATWRLCNGLTLFGSYTFTHDPKYREINGRRVDLNNTRAHNLLLKLDGYKSWNDKWSSAVTLIGQYLSGIEINTVSKEADDSLVIKTQNYDGYPMFRMTGSISFDRKMTFSAGVDNLLNYKAKNLGLQNASLTPGRIFFGKLTFQL
ncbi:MAG: TonB-dependent receptor [Porphyromonas sp.]|nr:TonB-dependent receptor [Porphyromonas sp.]